MEAEKELNIRHEIIKKPAEEITKITYIFSYHFQ